MTTKDFGASRYLDPEGRSFEQITYQVAKPIADAELNLQGDIATETERVTRRKLSPSGWISEDFLDTSDLATNLANVPMGAGSLSFKPQKAIVNGWNIDVNNTAFAGFNIFNSYGSVPTGAGVKRYDLVVLEVWRRLLDTTTTGKSHTGRIWLNGNVKVSAADDAALNFVDDILDTNIGAETAKRVQIQYRLRLIEDVDLAAYPYGMEDPTVVAHSVPAAPASPDGVAGVFTYSNQSANGDPGLWRAGDGIPANALGTVDGYMYAIPMVAINRRNDTAFDRNTNHNGGVAFGGGSDRPDGLFYDQVVEDDLIDLRLGVSPTGWNYKEVLNKNQTLLLDNNLKTEIGLTLNGGGVQGHSVLVADEIGITNGNGGDGTTTGDTPGATFIGQFDGVRKQFSDRPIDNLLITRVIPSEGSGGGPNWANGDVITIDPTALRVHPYATPFNFAAYAPANFSIKVCLYAAFIGAGGGLETHLMPDFVMEGLGEVPQGSITCTLGTIPAGVTTEDFYLYFIVEYPPGQGLLNTPVEHYELDVTGVAQSVQINNPAQMPAAAPILFDQLLPMNSTSVAFGVIDEAHREVAFGYQTVSHTITVSAWGVDTSTILVPEQIISVSGITVNGGGYAGGITINGSGLYITLDAASFVLGDNLVITCQTVRPMPQNDEQVTVYTKARVPQTGRDTFLGSSITVTPREISDSMRVISMGSGSFDTASPFPYQYLAGGVYPTSGDTYDGDHELGAIAALSVANFSTTNGYLQLPAMVPYTPSPDKVTYNRAPGDIDSEGRTFFKSAPITEYVPTAYAQVLSDPVVHKTSLSLIAELTVDSTFGMKGQLVLIYLSEFAIDTKDNKVAMVSALANNRTTASVYKIRGNLLNRRND